MSSTPANFGFGVSVDSGHCGSNVAPASRGFGYGDASRSNVSGGPLWQDNASEPFGRVESTAQCFTRNGEVATSSKWTPPKPPSRPLFQSHSTARGTVPLFGHLPQHQSSSSLFGTSSSNPSSSGNQTSVGGGFSFGQGNTAAPTTSSNSSYSFGTANTGFGTTGAFFGKVSSGMKSGFGNAGTVFGSGSSVGFNGESTTGFEGTRTVFGLGSNIAKPPLAPSSNPFTTSTSNPFAKKSAPASTSSPFTFTAQTPSSNDTSLKAPSMATNPFAMKVSSTASVNPFAAKISSTPTVNRFSIQQMPGTNKNVYAVPGSAVGAGSASMKFKSGLRPVVKPTASIWGTGWQQQQPIVSTQPASLQSFDWTGWEKKKESTLPKVEKSFPMPNASSSETKTSLSDSTSSTTPTSSQIDTLVASPDTNPYGSGSFLLIEEKIKTAIANPPSSVELKVKVLDDRSSLALSSSISRLQPSARFASRLGLARQPLQALPMRPVQPRFPTRRLHTVPSGAKLTQADPFRFSSSFSRLAISKTPLRIRVDPISAVVNVATDSSLKKSCHA